VVKAETEKMHLHMRQAHCRTAVGMVERRELQVK
jgi:hypothetical protein